MTKEQNTAFGAVASLVLLVSGRLLNVNLLDAAIIVLLITVLVPVVFTPFAWLWYLAGKYLERSFSIIILCVIYFLVVMPVGILRRFFAKDALNIRNYRKGGGSVFHTIEKTYCADELKYPY